jgi:uncharacterized protein (DUF983 family)
MSDLKPVKTPRPGRAGWLWALLRQRCPRCRQGRMFRGYTMNDPCPVCGLLFQREEGYFLGAMYVSYGLSLLVLVPCYLLAAALLPGQSSVVIAAAAMVPYLPFVPSIFCYSRVIWVYFERGMCPSDASAGPYEKLRLRQLAPSPLPLSPEGRGEEDKSPSPLGGEG